MGPRRSFLKFSAGASCSPLKKLDQEGACGPRSSWSCSKLPGLGFTHLFELLTFYNLLHEADRLELDERGGEKFRPQAERTIKKLARAAAKEEWSIAKLRAETKRAKDPTAKTPASPNAKPAFVVTKERATIDFTRIANSERASFAAKLKAALVEFGFRNVVISDHA